MVLLWLPFSQIIETAVNDIKHYERKRVDTFFFFFTLNMEVNTGADMLPISPLSFQGFFSDGPSVLLVTIALVCALY